MDRLAALFVDDLACHNFATSDTGWLDDGMVKATADIGAEKLEHQHVITRYFSPVESTTEPVHVAYRAGDLIAARVGPHGSAATGNATVTMFVKNKTTNVLLEGVTVDSSHAVFAVVDGTVSTAPYIATDILQFQLVAAAGTGVLPGGIFTSLVLREKSV